MPQTRYAEKTKWWGALGIAIATFLALYLYFDAELDPELLSKVYVAHAAVLLSLTFLIGSLSRFWPKVFNRYKPYRKALGIYGFLMFAGHIYTVMVPLHQSLTGFSAWTAWGALAIFAVMAITSNVRSSEKLGYALWKRIQLLGYAAMVLVGAYLYLSETQNGSAGFNSIQIVVLALVFLAVVMRLAAFSTGPKRHNTSYYDHVIGEDGEVLEVKPAEKKTRKRKLKKKKR